MRPTGTHADRSTPVPVPGLPRAVQVVGGYLHTCVLLDDRTVKCWGSNRGGELGDGTTTNRPQPVAVEGLADVDQITRTCARLGNGTAKCWGNNSSGQLGDGTTSDSWIPVAVAGISSAREIAGKWDHACARVGL